MLYLLIILTLVTPISFHMYFYMYTSSMIRLETDPWNHTDKCMIIMIMKHKFCIYFISSFYISNLIAYLYFSLFLNVQTYNYYFLLPMYQINSVSYINLFLMRCTFFRDHSFCSYLEVA